ncbi:hypothetical protein EGW08_006095, partial [Elysia chlorotica]
MGSSASVQRTCNVGVLTENRTTLASLEPGDLVKFQRCGYYHWAVYTGDGNVVHVTEQTDREAASHKSLVSASLDLSKVHISVQSFLAVAGSGLAYKANDRDLDWSPLPGDEIVERAMNFVGIGDVRYNLLTCNCEHFAKWCRYNRFQSDQIDNLKIYKPKIFMKTVLSALDAAKNKLKTHISKGGNSLEIQNFDTGTKRRDVPSPRAVGKQGSNNMRESDDDMRDKMKEIGMSCDLSLSLSSVSYSEK